VLKLLLKLPRLLNSIVFGIVLMAMVGLYIAVGSGLPSVRELLEMDEMQFFNYWPLKALMALMVANLAVVSVRRIPLTPARWGGWAIHLGIIVLIVGMALYYHAKLEGAALVPLRGSTANFYDRSERMLYVQISDATGEHVRKPVLLENLPRFRAYGPELGNARKLNLPTLPLRLGDQSTLADVNIVGYYPYADIVPTVEEDPSADTSGVRVSFRDPATGQFSRSRFLIDESIDEEGIHAGLDIEHHHITQGLTLDGLRQLAGHLHQIEVRIAGKSVATFDAQPGQTYPIAQSGYIIEVEQFVPRFVRSNGQIASLLTLKVTRPDKTVFRRQVINGDPLQTDFKLDSPGVHAFGDRQKSPLDGDLVVLYTLHDPQGLAPQFTAERHTFFTTAEAGTLFDVVSSVDRPGEVRQIKDGSGELQIDASGVTTPVKVERRDHMRRVARIQQVPPEQRDRDEAAGGSRQVLLVRISRDTWSQSVPLPHIVYAGETFQPWGEPIEVPGTGCHVRFKFGPAMWKLPAILRLEKFDVVSYPGGSAQQRMQRDFQSTLRLEDARTGEQKTAVVKLNNPLYYTDASGTKWLFYQSGWDQPGVASGRGARWTIIGVGNRGGVWLMTTGSIMMTLGLLWAFYVKPILLRRARQDRT